jgi:hypothetical protein
MTEQQKFESDVKLAEAENGKLLNETKEVLTQNRNYAATRWWGNDLYTDLERAYGKYLFIPFAIPKIVPNDMNKFVEFFFTKSQNAVKIRTDHLSQAGSGAVGRSPYKQITSSEEGVGDHSDVWSDNQVPEIYNQFPELFEQIHEYMPFIERQNFKWFMWSSNWDVPPHRDFGPQIDMPASMRIKIFDNNPYETLEMEVDPLDWNTGNYHRRYRLPIPEDTNSFAWNNLRQKHRSEYIKGHRKILMIISPKELRRCLTGSNLNKYVDLLDRSVDKYRDNVVVDTDTTFSDYLTFKESDPINKILNRENP